MSVEALPRAMRPSIQPSQQGLVMNHSSPRSAPARVYSPQIALKLQTFSVQFPVPPHKVFKGGFQM